MRTPVLRSPAVLLGVPAVAVAALGVGSMVGGVTPVADRSPDAAATQRVPGAQPAPPLVQAVPAAMPVVPLAPAGVSTVDDGGAGQRAEGAAETVASTGDDDAAPGSGSPMLTFDRGAAAQRHAAAPAGGTATAGTGTTGAATSGTATTDAAVSRTAPAADTVARPAVARHAAAPTATPLAAPAPAATRAASTPDDGARGSLLDVSTPVAGLSVLSFG